MRSPQAQAIRTARLAVRLTQEQLGYRIGLKGRAIYRWERDETRPIRRHRTALITAIGLLNPKAAEVLKAALTQSKTVAPAAPAPAAPAPPPLETVIDLALFSLAEELDVSARSARIALVRLCKQLAPLGVTLRGLGEAVGAPLLRAAAADSPAPSQGQSGFHGVADVRSAPG